MTSLVLERLAGFIHFFSFRWKLFPLCHFCPLFFFYKEIQHPATRRLYQADQAFKKKIGMTCSPSKTLLPSWTSTTKVRCSEDRSACSITPQPWTQWLHKAVEESPNGTKTPWLQVSGVLPTGGPLSLISSSPRHAVFGSLTHSHELQTQEIRPRALRGGGGSVSPPAAANRALALGISSL